MRSVKIISQTYYLYTVCRLHKISTYEDKYRKVEKESITCILIEALSSLVTTFFSMLQHLSIHVTHMIGHLTLSLGSGECVT
jgi:hypothetical protein